VKHCKRVGGGGGNVKLNKDLSHILYYFFKNGKRGEREVQGKNRHRGKRGEWVVGVNWIFVSWDFHPNVNSKTWGWGEGIKARQGEKKK